MKYLKWEQHWLPRQALLDNVNILHSPFNFGIPWSSHCPRVLTLHDAIDHAYRPAGEPSFSLFSVSAGLSRFYLWQARTRASHFLTPSEHARNDIVRFLRVPASKITVTYEAADPNFKSAVSHEKVKEVLARYAIERPYVFYIGGFEKRKNIPFLLRAFHEARLLNADLVLCGGQKEYIPAIEALARDLGVSSHVRVVGWVEDADLPALYAGALCFVYPSEYEGFGLQLCEAMSVGCPVLASDAASLPEILGDGGKTFSLKDTAELSGLLRRVEADSEFRSALSSSARQRGALFSWERTARQTLDVYSRLVSERSGG
jgi:glycosyltransferase involved in cell wall biosynthesis